MPRRSARSPARTPPRSGAPCAATAVRRIGIVGTGVIGSGWAAVFLARGFEVTAFVRSSASEAKFLAALEGAWHKLIVRGLATEARGWRAVRCVRDLAACVRGADYVQESVVEDLLLKQRILAEIDALAPASTPIGSSTSFIPLSLMRARARTHPERIGTAHPTLPAWDSFVECIGADEERTRWLCDFFARGVRMETVIAMRREAHGHVLNGILSAMMGTSGRLVHSGVCSAAEVDAALVSACSMVVAGRGMTGASIAMIGGGSPDALSELTTDIVVGGPVAKISCGVAWLCGRWTGLAALLIWCTQLAFCWVPAFRGLVRKGVGQWQVPFAARWAQLTPRGPAAFEEETLHRIAELQALSRARGGGRAE